ncbi:MAG: N-glycosylase/DNA lyase [Nanoarchaeota archaeon]|nr:N-glycosylase/DNA lyase [Nanoarchaeota archaeon]
MNNLKDEYKKHRQEIDARLAEFSQLNSKEHVKELFFCILTPQSNAEKCWQAINEIKNCIIGENELRDCLKSKTRFYKNKTKYILEANKKWNEIRDKINREKDPAKLRNWIAENIKGLGMKESSHFLRNVGKSDNHLAILDRHILRKMQELRLIKEIKIKNKKDYLEKEKILREFSNKLNIPLDHLDLLFWKLESGRIFK